MFDDVDGFCRYGAASGAGGGGLVRHEDQAHLRADAAAEEEAKLGHVKSDAITVCLAQEKGDPEPFAVGVAEPVAITEAFAESGSGRGCDAKAEEICLAFTIQFAQVIEEEEEFTEPKPIAQRVSIGDSDAERDAIGDSKRVA